MLLRILAGMGAILALSAAAPALPGKQDFTLINKSGFTVVSFNVSPAGEEEWGPNVLGSRVVKNGETAEITFEDELDTCKWDLRATYDDDDTTAMPAVDLCDVATVTLNP